MFVTALCAKINSVEALSIAIIGENAESNSDFADNERAFNNVEECFYIDAEFIAWDIVRNQVKHPVCTKVEICDNMYLLYFSGLY